MTYEANGLVFKMRQELGSLEKASKDIKARMAKRGSWRGICMKESLDNDGFLMVKTRDVLCSNH
jgi:hypothetical protein